MCHSDQNPDKEEPIRTFRFTPGEPCHLIIPLLTKWSKIDFKI